MENPLVLTRDHDFALELKAQGFNAELADVDGALVGITGLDKALPLRFLTDFEVAREKARDSRRRALMVFAVSASALAVAFGGYLYTLRNLMRTESVNKQLQEQQAARTALLATLYQERFASLARQESVHIREELFDLSLTLPPQVVLISLKKDAAGLSAVVERRPQAAPFSRADLMSALAASPFFAQAKVHEEYEGHLVRYVLAVPAVRSSPAAPATPPAARQP
jgi:Tfp pilus assembly protein PilN